jgi:hypothetical protein
VAAQHIGIIPSQMMRAPLPQLEIPESSLEKFAELAKNIA